MIYKALMKITRFIALFNGLCLLVDRVIARGKKVRKLGSNGNRHVISPCQQTFETGSFIDEVFMG